MKLSSALTLACFAAACLAETYSYPNDTFVIPTLITTTYTTDRRKGYRSHHMWFTLIDNSCYWEPQNSTCDVKWRTTDPAPSELIMCEPKSNLMSFEIQNFTDIKDFNLEIYQVYGFGFPTCCNSSDLFMPWAGEGHANITRDGLKWRRTRTTSGSTVSAVADEPIVMPIEYLDAGDAQISKDDDDDSGDVRIDWG